MLSLVSVKPKLNKRNSKKRKSSTISLFFRVVKGLKRGERVVYWILRLCNMAFNSGVVPEDWRSAMINPLYKGKGERMECSNYRVITLLTVVNSMQGS